MNRIPEGVSERIYSEAALAALLPHPAADAHKYLRGTLVLAAGSQAYPGAAVLAATAGQRAGAGYTLVETDAAIADVVCAASPSLVVRDRTAWNPIADEPSRPNRPRAYVVGPGFDAADPASEALALSALAALSPVLVDGGALDALVSEKARDLLRERFVNGLPTVVTPHAGEARRLAAPFGLPIDDPARLAWSLACAYGVVAVVKGPETWISDGDEIACMDGGTSALAKAGTGDVLAGVIGALLAQGLAPLDAAYLGAALHARAGRAAAGRLTDICVTAEDVVAALPDAVRSLENRQ